MSNEELPAPGPDELSADDMDRVSGGTNRLSAPVHTGTVDPTNPNVVYVGGQRLTAPGGPNAPPVIVTAGPHTGPRPRGR